MSFTWNSTEYGQYGTITLSSPITINVTGNTFKTAIPSHYAKGGNTYLSSSSARYFKLRYMCYNGASWQTTNYLTTTTVSNATTNATVPAFAGFEGNTSSIFKASNKTSRTYSSDVYISNAELYSEGSQWGWFPYGGDTKTVATINYVLDAPPTFSETFSYTNAFSGIPYANLTTANVTLSSLTAYYGGDFTGVGKAEFTIGSQTVSKANPVNNDVLSIPLGAVGTFTPTVKVTDSRGQVTTHTLTDITVQGYVAPSVSFSAERTTSTGTPDDEGTYAVISPKFTFTDAIATLSAPTVAVTDDGGTASTPTVTWYSTRASDGTLSGSVTWANLSSGDMVYGLVSITGNFNTQKSYQIAVTPTDSEGTGTTITQTLGSAFYTVDFYAGGHGIAFGQPASQTGFYCNMDAHFVDTLTAENTATFNDDVLIDLPDYTTSGTTDKSIYDAVVSLGWDSEVLI